MRKLIQLAWFMALLSAASWVHAWQLEEVTFEDGGTASGFFDLNSGSGSVSNFDIKTTAGSKRTAVEYTPTSASFQFFLIGAQGESDMLFTGLVFRTNLPQVPGNKPVSVLSLYTEQPLYKFGEDHFEASGTISLRISDPYRSSEFTDTFGSISRVRLVSGGAVTDVPECSILAFLSVGAGTAFLVFFREEMARINASKLRPLAQAL